MSKPKYSISESYTEYRKAKKNRDKLSRNQYHSVLARFFWLLARRIIVNKYVFKIPNRLGYLRIAKYKLDKPLRPIDWQETKKQGKLVRRVFNALSDEYYYTWIWEKKNKYTVFKNKSFYAFKPVVDWKNKKVGSRGLNHHIISLEKDPYAKPYDIARIG